MTIKFTQKLDHFHRQPHLANHTFHQKLVVDDSHWGGAKAGAPIFVYLGEINELSFPPSEIGILSLCASEFKGMLVQIEHRFYGESLPLGSVSKAMSDPKVRSCLTVDQALHDFAKIIHSLKTNLSAYNSPVVVMGTGYSGALAAWFRVEYPEVVVGAIASSTPILAYGSTTPANDYCHIVSEDFKDVDESCYNMLSQTWKLIDDTANSEGEEGTAQLSETFQTCKPMKSTEALKQRFTVLFSVSAQYDLPDNFHIRSICELITAEEKLTIDALHSVLYSNMMVYGNCLDLSDPPFLNDDSPFSTNLSATWTWLRCNELIVPVGCQHNTMLPAKPFNFSQFQQSCQAKFGVVPHKHSLARLTKNHSMEEYLTNSKGQIMFTNGAKDPYSSRAILKNLSESIVAITATNGSSGWDIIQVKDDDPTWLKECRGRQMKMVKKWVKSHADHSFTHIGIVFYFSVFVTFTLLNI